MFIIWRTSSIISTRHSWLAAFPFSSTGEEGKELVLTMLHSGVRDGDGDGELHWSVGDFMRPCLSGETEGSLSKNSEFKGDMRSIFS